VPDQHRRGRWACRPQVCGVQCIVREPNLRSLRQAVWFLITGCDHWTCRLLALGAVSTRAWMTRQHGGRRDREVAAALVNMEFREASSSSGQCGTMCAARPPKPDARNRTTQPSQPPPARRRTWALRVRSGVRCALLGAPIWETLMGNVSRVT
jgi:hypothetical protein